MIDLRTPLDTFAEFLENFYRLLIFRSLFVYTKYVENCTADLRSNFDPRNAQMKIARRHIANNHLNSLKIHLKFTKHRSFPIFAPKHDHKLVQFFIQIRDN